MNGGVSQMARVLDSINRPMPAMQWLQNAGRVMEANGEQWAAEDAENERLEAASRNASRAFDGVGQ